jgi:hypothetical protein
MNSSLPGTLGHWLSAIARRNFMWLERGRALAEHIPYSLVALVTRVSVASVFWRSGQTKVDGFFHIKDNTFYLFREEYRATVYRVDHRSAFNPRA